MEILVGSLDIELEIGHSAHSAVDGRNLVGYHCRVRNQDDVAGQHFPMLLYPCSEMLASDLLLSFDDEFHIVLQQAVPQEVFEGLHVHECLALVVIGAASPDGSVMDYRLERVTVPFLERLRRLHVIMTIDKHSLEGRVHCLAGEDHRVALCRIDSGLVSSGFLQQFRHPLGTENHVALVLRLCAHGRNPEESEQFLIEPFAVLIDVLPYG